MTTVIIQAMGVLVFLTGTLILGMRLKGAPDRRKAERMSSISHSLFHICLVFPAVVGVFYPGLTRFDEVMGLSSLPYPRGAFMLGILLLVAGMVLFTLSIRSLIGAKQGAAAMRLTLDMVTQGIYARARNPISLGYYLICVGVGLVSASTYITLAAVFVVIPLHVFNLLFFEERQLELRFGQSYRDYKRATPFLMPRLG